MQSAILETWAAASANHFSPWLMRVTPNAKEKVAVKFGVVD